ncbi:MAG: thiamine phosphate synthase [Epsilonproteobacteria bacterium]|nr:MAG: thiamine phosphate synthase [Campylobacterota bacterium]
MKSYLITNRQFYTDTPAVFRSILHEQFVKFLPDFALYRDKTNPNYAVQAEHFIEVCRQFEGIKGLIHGDALLAHKLNAYGVHFTSQQYGQIPQAKDLSLYVIASAHSEEEINHAVALGADAVTYSPIFSTPGKGEPKSLEDLKDITGKIKTNIFALGGIITLDQVKLCELNGAYGFASIRYFIDN